MKGDITSERTGITYTLKSYISGGSFGSVWLSDTLNDPDEKYAIKMMLAFHFRVQLLIPMQLLLQL